MMLQLSTDIWLTAPGRKYHISTAGKTTRKGIRTRRTYPDLRDCTDYLDY